MAQIQGSDVTPYPQFTEQSTAGQSTGQGIEKFMSSVGMAIQEGRRKKEEAQQKKQLVGLGMTEFGLNKEDSQAMVNSFPDPKQAAEGMLMFSEHRQKVEQQAQQQELLNQFIMSEVQGKTLEEQQRIASEVYILGPEKYSENKDKREDNKLARDEYQHKVDTANQDTVSTQNFKQAMGLLGHEPESPEFRAFAEQYAAALTNEGSGGISFQMDPEGNINFTSGGPNTVSTTSLLQKEGIELTNAISLGEQLEGRITTDNFGVGGFLKEKIFDKTFLADMGFGDVERTDARIALRIFVENAMKAITADPRISDQDRTNLRRMLPEQDTVFSSAFETEQVRKTVLQTLKMQRSLNWAYRNVGIDPNQLTEDQVIGLKADVDTRAHLLAFLFPESYSLNAPRKEEF